MLDGRHWTSAPFSRQAIQPPDAKDCGSGTEHLGVAPVLPIGPLLPMPPAFVERRAHEESMPDQRPGEKRSRDDAKTPKKRKEFFLDNLDIETMRAELDPTQRKLFDKVPREEFGKTLGSYKIRVYQYMFWATIMKHKPEDIRDNLGLYPSQMKKPCI